MKIRLVNDKDQEDFSRLYYLLYSDDEGIKSNPIPFDNTNFSNLLLVVEEESKLIGFIWGYFLALGIRRYGYVEDLFIEENHRNQGIASSLLTALKEEFKKLEVEAVFVTTEKDNQEAINLYLKEDFEVCPGPWFFWAPLKDSGEKKDTNRQ